jgi:hypothetical protein
MKPVTISGKRTWCENGNWYMECYCNSIHLAARYTGEPKKKDIDHLEQRMKNSCKLIKLIGKADSATYREWTLYPKAKELLAVELPEWDGPELEMFHCLMCGLQPAHKCPA